MNNFLKSLVDEGKETTPGREYMVIGGVDGYHPHETGGYNMWEHTRIVGGTILTNVYQERDESGRPMGFWFTIKETGAKYHTNYGWALGEHTPENITLIQEWEEFKAVSEQAQRIAKRAFGRINKLSK